MNDEKGPINPQQTGRMVQRLLEIETYRTMALLGLPHAREAAPLLADAERWLGVITTALASDSPGAGGHRPRNGSRSARSPGRRIG